MLFVCVADHYSTLAPDYDEIMSCTHLPIVNIIKHNIPLKKTDQIVDIGGGTGNVIQLLKREFDVEKPVACVEPNLKMLQVAMKMDGIIPIHSTAEKFFAKPNYPLDIVMMNYTCHHFHDPAGVFSNLAKYMSDEGTCMITQLHPPTTVCFSALLEKWITVDNEELYKILDSNNLKYKFFMWKEPVEKSKQWWYKRLRGRWVSPLSLLTDEEIEEGIRELEGKFGAEEILNFYLDIGVVIVTKSRATVS